MDWQQRMTAALDYLEDCVTGDFSAEEAGRRANCSPFHFMRMFEIVAGISPSEYVRRRRLSRAAIDLASDRGLILDIALRYGYESPDSFSRAFRREYGCLPSEAKRPGARLHNYPRIAFSVALKGERAMDYRIEKGDAIRMTGVEARLNRNDAENLGRIPRMWDETLGDGRYSAFREKARGSRLGLCGVCRYPADEAGAFIYSIAIEAPYDRAGLPEGCVDFEIPASTWAKFSSRGPLVPSVQDTLKRVWTEWFPSSGREHAGTAEIERYPEGDPASTDYLCECWVPLR